MNINKFYGTQIWITKNPTHKSQIVSAQNFFTPFCSKGRVLVTRYNGTYLSFRFCGLEMLQLKKDGKFHNPLYINSSKIIRRNIKTIVTTPPFKDVEKILLHLDSFLNNAFKTGNTKSKYIGSIIPGFSFEHWLESLIMSDTICGEQTRDYLKIDPYNLTHLVSQVPVIIAKGSMKKKRSEHIDLLALNKNQISIIELKKDDDYKKAYIELVKYNQWYNGKLLKADPIRGNRIAMEKEGYLPKSFISHSLTFRNVMVLVSAKHPSRFSIPSKIGSSLIFDLLILPDHWLGNAYKNINLFL